MTKKEAAALKSFKHCCTCGGHAYKMNGRPEQQPHGSWCPQAKEYEEWYQALHSFAAPKIGGKMTNYVICDHASRCKGAKEEL